MAFTGNAVSNKPLPSWFSLVEEITPIPEQIIYLTLTVGRLNIHTTPEYPESAILLSKRAIRKDVRILELVVMALLKSSMKSPDWYPTFRYVAPPSMEYSKRTFTPGALIVTLDRTAKTVLRPPCISVIKEMFGELDAILEDKREKGLFPLTLDPACDI